MYLNRNERRVHVILFQHGLKKLTRVKILLIFPEQLLLIHDTAAAHVEDGNGDHVFFLVIAEDVDIVITQHGHLLPFG